MRAGAIAGIGVLILVGGACQLIAGLEDRAVAVHDGGAVDGSITLEAGPGDPCTVVGTPTPNDAASSPSDSVSFMVALYSVDFGFDGGVGDNWGYNLDKVCTCPGTDSCVRPSGAQPACDGRNGVDTGGRGVFAAAQTFQIVNQDQLDQALMNGQSGALIRVDKYNGTADDSSVHVAVFSSLGSVGYGLGTAPVWDGTDQWTVDPGSVISGSGDAGLVAAYEDDGAFVRGGTLVSTLDFPVTIGSGSNSPVTIQLNGGVIVADITKQGNGAYALSGTLAGRWPANTLLTSLQIFPDPIGGGNLCGTDPTYQGLKTAICGLVDINRSSSNDNAGYPCDALGIGLHFTARQAEFGPLQAREAGTTSCPPAWKDSCQ